jgi:MFS family permease
MECDVTQAPDKPASKAIRPLLSLNFFMADMQAGIGPFLGVFLLAHGWQCGLIRTVMTVGGVPRMVTTTPAGALVDATRRKKLYVIIPGICTVIASGIILLSQNFWLVTVSQVATAIAGAAIGPAMSGITLGIVRQAGFEGAVMTVQGLGASLSPAIGGRIAQEIGYGPMFLMLGSFAPGSIVLWLGFASLLRAACARPYGSSDQAMAATLAIGAR